VSSATIVNWIKAGKLPAQRTAGGQYRIHRSDLRTFMSKTGMKTDALDRDMRPFCWEAQSCGCEQACATCPIRLRSELDCFLSRARGETHPRCVASCAQCTYHAMWASPPP
jgi:excisionase family DNA binding protein